MKILVLGSRIPYPQRDGGAIATYGMLKEMASQGCDVTFFSFNTKKHFVSDKDIREQFSFCKVIPVYLDANPTSIGAFKALLGGKNYNIARFESNTANTALEKLLLSESFDVIHFEGLFAVPFLPVVLKHASKAVKVLRQHNLEYTIWERLAAAEKNAIKQWYLHNLANSLKKYEIKVLEQFQWIVSITAADEEEFKKINPKAAFFLYPAGMEFDKTVVQKETGEHTLCHIGSMEWMPNVQAVQWFVDEVWPKIVQHYPDAEFHIAGKSLQQNDPRFLFRGVVNHGEVSNAREFVSNYAIVVVPLLSGSGLRMKTLEAMVLGKAVVSTPMGAEGIEYTDGKNIMIAHNPSEWVSAIGKLFENKQQQESLGSEGRKLVLQHYSLQKNTENLLQFYKNALSKPKA